MAKGIRYLFTLGVPAALAIAGSAYVLGMRPQGGGPAYTYDTVTVGKGQIRKLVSSSGPVRALVTVSIGSQLSGQIAELKVDFNAEVKAGDVLAVLDNKTFAAKVAQAKADLATAKALLTAALEKAEAVLKSAERVAARQSTLAAKGIAATVTVDNATRDMDVAKADIAVAKAQIESARAQIAQREAQLEQAMIDLERTIIRSPIDGTVIGRTIDIGQTVAASLQAPELFKIAQDLRRIRIEAQVNEADVGAVAEGNTVTFTVDAYPELRFTGLVTQVRLAATELQNVVTYTVIIEAANAERKLFPGMTANVQIETAKRDGVARIPMDALRFKPRNAAAASAGAPAATTRASPEERERRMAELTASLKTDIGLSEEQIAKVKAELAKGFQGRRSGAGAGSGGPSAGGDGPGGGAAPDPAQIRARMLARTAEAVASVITSDQRPAFEAWRRTRETARTASIWLLGETGQPVSRQIRIGIADDQFAEVLGETVKDGERVIVRAREVKK
ncbi:MAG TPA: efflux RND transporter periplasmic adaptor subunit [Hyphomicrobiaceae bacterium]|nr:efflux RND transporter periplasmic adaptor subunit [Hyphomicrobiaceae bacterium]